MVANVGDSRAVLGRCPSREARQAVGSSGRRFGSGVGEGGGSEGVGGGRIPNRPFENRVLIVTKSKRIDEAKLGDFKPSLPPESNECELQPQISA